MTIRQSQKNGGKTGRMLRPKVTVLKRSALVPAEPALTVKKKKAATRGKK